MNKIFKNNNRRISYTSPYNQAVDIKDIKEFTIESDKPGYFNNLENKKLFDDIIKDISYKIIDIIIDNNKVHRKVSPNIENLLFEGLKAAYENKIEFVSMFNKYDVIQSDKENKIYITGEIAADFKNCIGLLLKTITIHIDKSTNNIKNFDWSGTVQIFDLRLMHDLYWKEFFTLKDRIYCLDKNFRPNKETILDVPVDERFLYPFIYI